VPTDRGYRFYVDLLLNVRRPSRAATLAARLRQQAGGAPALDDLLDQVSHLLSAESRHVGFAISPARGDARLHKVEFVSLAASKVMVIIVATSGQVWQKVVDIGEPLGPEELRRAAEYLNREFHGLPVAGGPGRGRAPPARGSDAVRPAPGPRVRAGQPHAGRRHRAAHAAPRGRRDAARRGVPAAFVRCRSPRCARCSR
jgi:hypothetical protein